MNVDCACASGLFAIGDAAMAVHIQAHGTSTPANDSAEANAITTMFGQQAPPGDATKGAVGHLIGGRRDLGRGLRRPQREPDDRASAVNRSRIEWSTDGIDARSRDGRALTAKHDR
jgi:hypothetical protein